MSNVLPAITLYQPWATWIMREWKTIETRTHNRFACLNKKTILIHAGLTTDDSDLVTRNAYMTHEQIFYKPNEEILNGFILGSAYVRDYSELNITNSHSSLIDCSLQSPLRYGLFLEKIQIFDEPIPVSGSVGIWYFDMDKKKKVSKPRSQARMF